MSLLFFLIEIENTFDFNVNFIDSIKNAAHFARVVFVTLDVCLYLF